MDQGQGYDPELEVSNSQTYQDLTLGGSRYEQDLSNLQFECSVVIDMKEKKRLVAELYCKKLMFKCFAQWANTMLDSSDYEPEEVAQISFCERY